jgi:hypothetical protein
MAYTMQEHIGWGVVLDGRLAIHWRQAQQDYFTLIGSRRSGRRWTIALIKKLADVAWDLWSYRNYLTNQIPSPQDNEANLELDELILNHRDQGLSILPDRYAWMFSQSGEEIMRSHIHVKRAWLTLLITAKSRILPLPGLFKREQEALNLYSRDTRCKRRKIGHVDAPPTLKTTATRIRSPKPWYDIDFTVDDLNVFNDINDEGHASALDSWFNDWRNS